MYSNGLKHASFKIGPGQMFSFVQDPPKTPTLWEQVWHGKKVGRTPEETSTCIRGVPGSFVANQPLHANSSKARSLLDHKVVPGAAPLNHLYASCSTFRYPPIVSDASFANHSDTTYNRTAKCQKAVTNLYDLPHHHASAEVASINDVSLPLEDWFIDSWREVITKYTHLAFADEVLDYWQAEANELFSRNVTEVDIYIDLSLCRHLDPETKKYIKCTVITSLSESCSKSTLQQHDHLYPDETPD